MMKKRLCILFLAAALLLTGCALPEAPAVAADGTPWSGEWTTIGAVLGVENVDGWKNIRNEDLLADTGMYFASWVTGESSEGVYPAQVFLVLSQCETSSDAEELVGEWTKLAGENYNTEAPGALEHRLGTFSLIPYTCGDDSTFDRGISCVGIVGKRAVNLEVSCMEDVELDLQGTVTEFLNGFHFAD